ncbi:MAG: nuclear transport factor 2 family protein [Pseudomonadota bacterium]
MSDHPESLNHMLAAWNERDQGQIRGHLKRALSPGVRFVDPSIDLTGIDAFEANIRKVQAQVPGADYLRVSPVDSQNRFHRYHWAIRHDGKTVLEGFDVTQTDEDGRVTLVIGFFGRLERDA